jgi:hypothetical protein
MPLITSSRYSAVAATLALALGAAGTGYAATTLPHDRSAHRPASTDTSPTLVVSVAANGKVNGDLHRAPITGRTTIKHPSTGFYIFKTPGTGLRPSDSATCTPVDYLAATATVDAVNHALAVHLFDASGNPANLAFRCAFWRISAKS